MRGSPRRDAACCRRPQGPPHLPNDAARGTGGGSQARCRGAACPPQNIPSSSPQPPCGRAAAECPADVWPAWIFPCPARRSIKYCGRRRRRSPWRAGPPAGPGHLQSPVRPGARRVQRPRAVPVLWALRPSNGALRPAPYGQGKRKARRLPRPRPRFRRERTGGARPAAPRPAPWAARPSHCARRRPAKARR